MSPERRARPRRPRSPLRARPGDVRRLRPDVPAGLLAVLAPVVLVGVCLWLLSGYSAVVDSRTLVLEVVVLTVVAGAAALARTSHARQALALLSAYVGLTVVGDTYWLLSVDPSGLSYTAGEFEPGFTVTVEVVRYLALLALLAHARPRSGTAPAPWRARGRAERLGGGAAVVQMQATAGTAALVLLCTPAGALVDDGTSSSVFYFFDVATAATAVAVALRALGGVPRPGRAQLRRLLATAVGVVGLVVGDGVTVLSQSCAWLPGGALGVALAVGGAVVLVVTYLRAAPGRAGAASALPVVPSRARPHAAVAVNVLVQNVLPLLVVAVTTAQVAAARHGGDPVGRGIGPATLGTAAAALALSLLRATVQSRRAHRDEHAAAVAESDELTGAYTRRGFSASAQRCLGEGTSRAGVVLPGRRRPPPDRRAGGERAVTGEVGWCVALLDLDGFKDVNDTFGHDAGDQVLRTVAERAAAVVDGHGILARFGGDEFVVLACTGSPTAPATQRLVQELEDVLSAPTLLDDGRVVRVGVSIGLAGVDDGRGDALAVALKVADRRMYTRKHSLRP